MSTSITATVANKFVGDHRSDLLLIGLLCAAGIPAISVDPGWKFGVKTSVPGTLTSSQGKTDTTFTWTPVAAPADPKDAQISALQSKLESASAWAAVLQSRATTAEGLNASLTSEVSSFTTMNAAMTAKLSAAQAANDTLNAQLAAMTAKVAAAEASLKPAIPPAPVEPTATA